MYKLEFPGSKFVFAHIVHTTAEVGIEPGPLAQESETLPPGHCFLRFYVNVYGRGNFFYKATHYDPSLQDRRWTATDAIEDGYSLAYLLIITAQLS